MDANNAALFGFHTAMQHQTQQKQVFTTFCGLEIAPLKAFRLVFMPKARWWSPAARNFCTCRPNSKLECVRMPLIFCRCGCVCRGVCRVSSGTCMQSAMKENFDLQATYLETLLKYRWYVPGVLVVALIQPCTWKSVAHLPAHLRIPACDGVSSQPSRL